MLNKIFGSDVEHTTIRTSTEVDTVKIYANKILQGKGNTAITLGFIKGGTLFLRQNPSDKRSLFPEFKYDSTGRIATE